MEKSFLRLKHRARRKAYVEAELVNGVSHQIRILRQQRNWTQLQLAKRLSTTQGVVSRLEDPSYGKFSMKTLLQVGDAFDVALQVRFMAFSDFMCQTWDTSPKRFEVTSYKEELAHIDFFVDLKVAKYVEKIEAPAPISDGQHMVVTFNSSVTPSLSIAVHKESYKPTLGFAYALRSKVGDRTK